MSPLLQARRVGRRNPTGTGWLLQDISLAIGPGERVAVIGPTGAGKTLLLRALALLDPLDCGDVLWRGRCIPPHAVPSFRSQVIYVHQRPALVSGTVEENLRFPFSLGVHRRSSYDRDRVLRLLAAAGRDESFLSRSDHELSGGERQIVALLRTVQLDPSVLLLDEPTAALDADSMDLVESIVRNWQRQADRAFIWVSHSAAQVRRIANRILSMDRGRLHEESTS